MSILPEGIVTFLFTDIEGSTRLWEEHPDTMGEAMTRHDTLVEDIVANGSGQVVRPRGEGDSRFAVFSRATDAIASARDIQRALADESWPTPRPLRVRLALHTGEADLRAGDYYGSDVNRCARLRAIAHGGQTLLSQATFDLVRDALPPQVTLRDLGEHRLKDLQRPEHVFQLDVVGLPAEFPSLQSIDAFPNNLPIQLTSFVGRAHEVKEVEQLLGTAHLLTLTGPGGTGKTRLGLQLTAEVLEEFKDGVWLVELAPITDALLVPQTVAGVLGVPQVGRRPVSEVLGEFLRSKQLLLLLDNCEHLIEDCAILASKLLRACPGLKILATSREPLGISGETIYRVPSLDLPESKMLDATQLAGYGAIRLFVERAVAVKSSFRLTEANAAAVAQLCERLDGIPLAIELAAARVKALSPEQIAARLDDRFRLLTGGSRTALPRQQTLRALIDWSYELLSDPERMLLRRLSVFTGGWTLEAAEAVGEEDDVLDLLARLVDRSLVIAEEMDDGGTRYRFLETIRQYARDKLIDASEAEMQRDRHMRYFEQLSAECRPMLLGIESPRTNERLQAETGNILSAMTWAAERDPELALRIAGNLQDYRGRGLHTAGMGPAIQTALDRLAALPAASGAVSVEREHARAVGLAALGRVKMAQGDMNAATSILEHAVAQARILDDKRLLSNTLAVLASAFSITGAFAEAEKSVEESLKLGYEFNFKEFISFPLGVRGRIRGFHNHDYAGARADLEEAVRMAEEAGNRAGMGMTMATLAWMDILEMRYPEAAAGLEEAIAVLHQARDWAFENVARSGLADARRLMGEYPEAAQLYRQMIRNHQLSGNQGGIARCLECLAFMQIDQAQTAAAERQTDGLRRAAMLFGAAESIRTTSGATMSVIEPEEYARYVAELRSLMDDRVREHAWAEGRRMTVEQVLGEANS